jgi:hypothetical protein
VIATTSSGRRFGVLATYLMRGRDGNDPDRVAWIAGRNLGTDDPTLAAALMQATADGNVRVDVPVYHLTINFDPADPVTPERMQQIAEQVLADLGLAEHQALLVAHRDRTHPHVHCMVNRVHPQTERAWERWQDRPQIERTLRELERELGLREVAGRLYQLEGQEPPERARLTNGERRQAERTGEPAFPDRVRAHLEELRAARSWAALEEVLEQHGLHLERKGQGLVITDGEHHVKASRVARELSLCRLEERFGEPYPERSAAVEELQRTLREHEAVAALDRERTRAEQELAVARDRQRSLDTAQERVEHGSQQFDVALARVYREPAAARQRFAHTSKELGVERAAAILDAEPERYGALKTVEGSRAFGLVATQDDGAARQAALGAAWRAEQLGEAERALSALVREHQQRAGPAPELPSGRSETPLDVVRARAAEFVVQAHDRVRRLGDEIARGPSRAALERTIARGVDRLLPHELAQLRRVLTAPQAVIASRVRQTLKDLALGRDDLER